MSLEMVFEWFPTKTVVDVKMNSKWLHCTLTTKIDERIKFETIKIIFWSPIGIKVTNNGEL